MSHVVADDSLQYRFGGVGHPVAGPGAVTNDVWQLIEVHRDEDYSVQVIVNGVSVHLEGLAAVGDAASANYLSRFKGSQAMYGDMAATLVTSDFLNEQERQDVRSYFDAVYDYLSQSSP